MEGFYKKTAIWNIKIPESEKIITQAQVGDDKMPKNSFIIENNFVLYKLNDLNNALLLTRNKSNSS